MLPEALWDSATRHVFTLPGETLLFCGHTTRGRTVSNVLEQRHWHPWLGGTTRDEFLARVRMPSAGAQSIPSHNATPVRKDPVKPLARSIGQFAANLGATVFGRS